MYYNDRPDIVEGNDIIGVAHLSTSYLADGRVILHADLVLRPDKAYESPENLHLHITDGATHTLLTPDATSPAWREPLTPVPDDDRTSEQEELLTEADRLTVRRAAVVAAEYAAPEADVPENSEESPNENQSV